MTFWVYWIAAGVICACVGLVVWLRRKRRQRKASRDLRQEIIAWAMEMEDLGIISSHHYDDPPYDDPPREGVLLPKILVDQFKEIAKKIHTKHHEDDPTERILRDQEKPEDSN